MQLIERRLKMGYSIIELSNGDYQYRYQIQDGVEQGTSKTRKEAIHDLINAAKFMNGMTITEKDIHFEPQIPHFTSKSSESSPLAAVMRAVDTEYRRAVELHGPFSSTHEGYAIIKEELDELWDGVKRNDPPVRLREEAIQIAAMAIRFCIDI